MTAQDIIDKLFLPIDKERVEKAKGLASRSRMDWNVVLGLMTPEQRKQVEAVYGGG